MQKFFRFAVAAVALAQCLTVPASALVYRLGMYNRSGTCAWVTVYGSVGTAAPFTIYGGNDRPRLMRNDDEWTFAPNPDDYQFKVRAEFTKNADCKGGTVRDTFDTYLESVSRTSLSAVLRKVDGQYWVRIER